MPVNRRRLAGAAESRCVSRGLEVRSSTASDVIRVSGSPIVYNVGYKVRDKFGTFEETMMPGVAAKILATADTRFLFNHDGMPLARTIAGTMILTDGPTALRFTAELDARQQLATDLAVAIERGDVSQMSCGFIVGTDVWNKAETYRTVHSLSDLLDVSAVTYPASPTTDIVVDARRRRELAEIRAGRRGWSSDLSPRDELRLELAVTRYHIRKREGTKSRVS